jgi:hypothetical protein
MNRGWGLGSKFEMRVVVEMSQGEASAEENGNVTAVCNLRADFPFMGS